MVRRSFSMSRLTASAMAASPSTSNASALGSNSCPWSICLLASLNALACIAMRFCAARIDAAFLASSILAATSGKSGGLMPSSSCLICLATSLRRKAACCRSGGICSCLSVSASRSMSSRDAPCSSARSLNWCATPRAAPLGFTGSRSCTDSFSGSSVLIGISPKPASARASASCTSHDRCCAATSLAFCISAAWCCRSSLFTACSDRWSNFERSNSSCDLSHPMWSATAWMNSFSALRRSLSN